MNGRQRRKWRARCLVWDYLTEHPCVDCGEDDPAVLTFDHVRGVKLADVSRRITAGSLTAIRHEIAKCDVRCQNCHTRKDVPRLNPYLDGETA